MSKIQLAKFYLFSNDIYEHGSIVEPTAVAYSKK
jgi:hypothetical protein